MKELTTLSAFNILSINSISKVIVSMSIFTYANYYLEILTSNFRISR